MLLNTMWQHRNCCHKLGKCIVIQSMIMQTMLQALHSFVGIDRISTKVRSGKLNLLNSNGSSGTHQMNVDIISTNNSTSAFTAVHVKPIVVEMACTEGSKCKLYCAHIRRAGLGVGGCGGCWSTCPFMSKVSLCQSCFSFSFLFFVSVCESCVA